MMMRDFSCPHCGNEFEALVPSDQDKELCTHCGEAADKMLSAPYVTRLHDPLARAESLRKRSFKHSVEEARKNPEKLAKSFGGKPRVQNGWNVRNK